MTPDGRVTRGLECEYLHRVPLSPSLLCSHQRSSIKHWTSVLRSLSIKKRLRLSGRQPESLYLLLLHTLGNCLGSVIYIGYDVIEKKVEDMTSLPELHVTKCQEQGNFLITTTDLQIIVILCSTVSSLRQFLITDMTY